MDVGTPLWDLTVSNIVVYVLVILSLSMGPKSSGKVVYVTATFPYLVLIILFFFGVTQKGAGSGISFYLNPDWSKLSDPDIWTAAATQIFFSLGVGFGGLITMSSFNDFHNNIARDTLIVCIGNCLTSFFAGFVIFSILGNMSFRTGIPVAELADAGPGLVFIAYPSAISFLPVPQLWSSLFFAMLISLGLASTTGYVEPITTGIMDKWPNLRKYRIWILLSVCVSGLLLGLLMTSPGGYIWFNIWNDNSANHGFLIVTLFLVL